MILWLPLVRLANQPTITTVALCQQGWAPLLHTKTKESLCAHIGSDYVNVCQYAGKVRSHVINILQTQHTYFTPSTHTCHLVQKTSNPMHILHPQQTSFTPSTHTSHEIYKFHTQHTHFAPNTHTSHPTHISQPTHKLHTNTHTSHPTHTLQI